MKSYSLGSDDLIRSIERVQDSYHEELEGVRVAGLFIFDDDSGEPVLCHQGYAAQAVCRLTPIRDRALGVADAVIVADRANWLTLSHSQREALIDHELSHLERVIDGKSGKPKTDAIGRPKLAMRMHDHQLGWFDAVAQRHKEDSPEIRQARQLIASTGQLYFDFPAAPPPMRPRRASSPRVQ
jgi:hypothetical protein